ncbi:MAG TPA: hypothetical protein VLF60_00060 [Candidatus Saccharimonadales bacterium]|nr:hypothetical protein [Candidatus Saccharimonadales bacterium]
MPELIDYTLVRHAAHEAMSEVKGDVGRVGHDIQSILQQLNQHSSHLANLRTQTGQVSELHQQIDVLKNQVIGLNAKVDQLTNLLQNVVARLPQ